MCNENEKGLDEAHQYFVEQIEKLSKEQKIINSMIFDVAAEGMINRETVRKLLTYFTEWIDLKPKRLADALRNGQLLSELTAVMPRQGSPADAKSCRNCNRYPCEEDASYCMTHEYTYWEGKDTPDPTLREIYIELAEAAKKLPADRNIYSGWIRKETVAADINNSMENALKYFHDDFNCYRILKENLKKLIKELNGELDGNEKM